MRTIRVLIYNGEYSASKGPYATRDALISANKNQLIKDVLFKVDFAKAINKDTLKDHDVLVMPGGSGGLDYLEWSKINGQAIKDFVANGNGYMGTCAGAYAGASKVEGWYNGWGVAPHIICEAVTDVEDSLPVQMVRPESLDLGDPGNIIYMMHWAGPVMKDPSKQAKIFGIFADNQTGHKNYIAIAGDYYGKGRSILCSPHPELPPIHWNIVARMVAWAAPGTSDEILTDKDVSDVERLITRAMYSDMSTRLDKWLLNHNNVPPYIIYLNSGGKGEYVTYARWKDMWSRYWNWYETHNHVPANNIWIKKPGTTEKPVTKNCYSSPKVKLVRQPDDYTCGPTSSVMALYELGIIDSVDNLADLQYTARYPGGGTGPNELIAGCIADAKKFNVKLSGSKCSWSDLGWDKFGQLLDDPDAAVIAHAMTDGWPSYYAGSFGHYVYPIKFCKDTDTVWVADPDRGIITYSFKEFLAGILMISEANQMIILKKTY